MQCYYKLMKFLVFQHVPHEHPGLIATFARNTSIALDVVELWKPYTLPPVTGYDALIIMGGPMGVYMNEKAYPSKNDELHIIRDSIGKIPMIGFCLGSQLLAHALAAEIHPNSKDGKPAKEIGYCAIDLTDAGKQDHLFTGFSSPVTVLQWHGDAFELPQEAILLATSAVCTNQAFRYKNAYGVLFHFEFTPEMVAKQIDIDRKWIHTDHKLDEQALLTQAREYKEMMENQSKQLLTNFLSIVTSTRGKSA